jgi:hypothetical protein
VTLKTLLILLAGLWIAWQTTAAFLYWLQGRRGLGQWPTPHGRHYNEWMRLPEGAGDYYEWLARRMGNREPWRTWAELERKLDAAAETAGSRVSSS